jgi:hypothetical protein
MIKYALRCDQDHNWDAWFPSISGYDAQAARGLIDCPFCGSKKVEKAPMAPALVTSVQDRGVTEPSSDVTRSPAANSAPNELAVSTTSDVMGLRVPEPVKAMLAELKARVEASHDYVGDRFAREARAMHEGETEERPIYGQATLAEVRDLIEDDIPVAPLPLLASPKGFKGVH